LQSTYGKFCQHTLPYIAYKQAPKYIAELCDFTFEYAKRFASQSINKENSLFEMLIYMPGSSGLTKHIDANIVQSLTTFTLQQETNEQTSNIQFFCRDDEEKLIFEISPEEADIYTVSGNKVGTIPHKRTSLSPNNGWLFVLVLREFNEVITPKFEKFTETIQDWNKCFKECSNLAKAYLSRISSIDDYALSLFGLIPTISAAIPKPQLISFVEQFSLNKISVLTPGKLQKGTIIIGTKNPKILRTLGLHHTLKNGVHIRGIYILSAFLEFHLEEELPTICSVQDSLESEEYYKRNIINTDNKIYFWIHLSEETKKIISKVPFMVARKFTVNKEDGIEILGRYSITNIVRKETTSGFIAFLWAKHVLHYEYSNKVLKNMPKIQKVN
jgi:hypothetical protein